jgi:hypothetical protein
MNRLRMGASMAPCGKPRYRKPSLFRKGVEIRSAEKWTALPTIGRARYENIKGPSARGKRCSLSPCLVRSRKRALNGPFLRATWDQSCFLAPAPGRGWATSFQKRGGSIVRDADKSVNSVALAHDSCGTSVGSRTRSASPRVLPRRRPPPDRSEGQKTPGSAGR